MENKMRKILFFIILAISFFATNEIANAKPQVIAIRHDSWSCNFDDYSCDLQSITVWIDNGDGTMTNHNFVWGTVNGEPFRYYYSNTSKISFLADIDAKVQIDDGYLQIQVPVSTSANVCELTSGKLIYNNVNVPANVNFKLPLNNLNIPYFIQLIKDGQLIYQNSHFNNQIQGVK